MKKILALCVSVLLLVGLLASCGGGGIPSSAGSQAPPATAGSTAGSTEPQQPQGDPTEIVMTYITLGQVPADLQMIEDAVNEISIREINVKVTLFPIAIFELASQPSLMISSGEKLDLLLLFLGTGPTYVNKGQLLELDDLYAQYGANIAAAEGIAMAGGYFNGSLYYIPSEEKMARQNGYVFRKDIMEKYNLSLPEGEFLTYEILDDWFSTIKAGEGSDFYMNSTVGVQAGMFNYVETPDVLGASYASGGLLNAGRGDTTVLNLFDTEEYKTSVEWLNKWNRAGYLHPDGATMTEAAAELMKTGRYLGTPMTIEADMISNVTRDYGYEMVGYPFRAPHAMTSIYQISCWSLPITCDDPAAAMQFLNLMYGSEEICNLLHNGIEGVHYEMTENPGIIRYPEGLDVMTTGYNNPLGLYGDKSMKYQWEPISPTYFEDLKAFNASITPEMESKALGYCFNSDPVKTEYAAVSDVISQYRPSLENGAVDPDTVLPEFISALKAAGIDTVIAENQKQLDAWLAAQ